MGVYTERQVSIRMQKSLDPAFYHVLMLMKIGLLDKK